MSTDINYLTALTSEFFSEKSIQKKLRLINERNISGWETWLQIELATFLHEHASEPDWEREVTLSIDKRREKSKLTIRPDFIIRKKGWQKDRYMAVELKINPSVKSCIHNLMADFVKLGKMKRSELDIRSYWGIGLFLTQSDNEIPTSDIVENKILEWGFDCDQFATTNIFEIPKTPYSYIVL